jgi:hypothetical protein
MANQSIGLGSAADDGTGDNLRVAIDKVNDNFLEIYTLIGDASSLTSGISATATVVTLAAPTITGTATMADLDISGDVDVDGTLEADAITIDGVSLAETISDTVGAMVGSNTETGITVTYEDGDNTLDFVMGTTQSTITSLTNAALVVGRDADNDIDFATDNNIIFRAGGADQIKLIDGALAPVTDSDIDLGTSSLEFKDAFFDGTVTSDAFAGPLTGEVTGNAATATTLATARTIGGTSFNGSANIAVALSATATALATARTIGGTSFDGSANIAVALSATATALATARTIGGVSFNGTANINLPGVNSAGNQNTSGSAATLTTARTIGGTSFDGSANIAVALAAAATTLETARTIGGVSFNGSANINLPGVNAAGNQSTSGLAATATALATARTIGGTSFDGSANIAVGLAATATALATARTIGGTSFDGTGNIAVATAILATTVTITDNESTNESNALIFTAGGDVDGGNLGLESDGTLTYNPSTGKVTATGFVGTLTGNVTGNASGTALTVTQAAQTNITSVGTLTALQIDNLNLNGNTLSSTAGTDLLITPLSGQQIVLDGTIVIDAGVVTGATSITSTAFVGDITGDVTGNADTATTLATARTIGGTSFNGSANIAVGLAATATALATARTIGGTSFDGSANIGVGLAATATALATARTIAGVSFNGTANITLATTDLTSVTAVAGEVNALDLGSTAIGIGIASKAVVLDSAKDYTGIRNLTITGEIDAATGDYSGAVDVAGATTVVGLTATGDIKATDGVVSGKREIISTFNTSSAVTGSLTRAQSGGILLIDGTEDNVINLPAAATANVGTFYDYIVLTIGASDKTTIFNIAGSGGNFFGTLSLSGGTAANAVIDNGGDALTLVNSTVVGSRGRITCLVDNGTNGTWQVESVGSPIATIA